MLRDHRRVRLELAAPTSRPGCWSSSSRSAPASTARSSAVSSCTAALMRSPPDAARAAGGRPPRAAPDRALHRRRASPCRVQAPARTTFGLAVAAPRRSRSRPGSQRERRARLAADARPDQLGRRRAARRAAPAIRSTSSRPRISSSSGAPLETTVRYWPLAGVVSGERAAVEHPVGGAAEQRGQLELEQQARSKSRWTLTIGESLERRLGLAEEPGGLGRRQRDDDRVARSSSSERSSTRCRASRRTRARRFERPAGRVAVHLAERRDREHEVARARLAEQRRPHGEGADVGARLVGRAGSAPAGRRRPRSGRSPLATGRAGAGAHRRSRRRRLCGSRRERASRARRRMRSRSGTCR